MKGWTLAYLHSLDRDEYAAVCDLHDEYVKALDKD
jgi:hypothetical protein